MAMSTDVQESASLSRQLSRYAGTTPLEAIPREVVAKATLCILDTVGCMIGGTTSRVGGIAVRHAVGRGGEGPCTVIGTDSTRSIEAAALANTTLAHVLELDDGHRPSDNHLGCVVVPAALAAAEQVDATGGDLLRAVILGYDVMGRIGQAVCLPRLETPFHHTSTTAPFGAAAAAGLVLGLGEDELTHALGIAGTAAAGLREVRRDATDCKPYQVARGAAAGVNAVLMAQDGLLGPAQILEGANGYVHAFTDIPRPELITRDLGSRFVVTESAFKIHATCGRLFTAIDACLALREELGLTPDAIDEVVVGLPRWIEDDAVFTRHRPADAGIAKFSVPFGVAVALERGEVTPDQMSEDGIRDSAIAALEAKVSTIVDPEVDDIYERTKDDDFFQNPCSVTVTVKGERHRRLQTVPVAYDTQTGGLTESQVIAKFMRTTGAVLGTDRARRAADQFLALEDVGSVREIVPMLGRSA